VAAYLLSVGVPVMGLLGVLEAGRGIPAPLSIGGQWTLEFDPAVRCAKGPGYPRPSALSISQSGTSAVITLNDGHATALEATVNGTALTAKSSAAGIAASISGRPGERTLEGKMELDGCAPVAFRAVRQAPKRGGA
jgi:hypothetical protein